MKVTIVVGGRWHAFDLALELERKGHLHKLITNYPAWFVRKWGIPGKRVVSLPLTFFLVKLIYKIGGESLMMRMQWIIHQRFSNQAAKYLEGTQILHAWSGFAEPSLIWAKSKRVPTVLERSSAHILEQSFLLESEYSRLGSRWNHTHLKIEEMECREYDLASVISVPSRFVQDTFKKRGFLEPKVRKHLLGANLNKFQPSPRLNQFPKDRIRNGLKILFAGSLTPQKGVHDLLEGFKSFSSSSSSLTLLGGGMSREIDQIIRRNNDKRILLPGHQSQDKLINYYLDHDVLVLPSIQDGFGMVLAQALCCGLPIISSTNTGGVDLLELDGLSPRKTTFGEHSCLEYSAGWIIPTRSPEILSSIFQYLLENPEVLLHKKSASLHLRNTDISWDSYASALCSTYSSLLDHGIS